MADSLGDRRSEQQSFTSMIYFPKNEGTRLVQVRALSGEFPYYGELETVPASAGRSFRNGQAALVDQTVMLQFNAKVGDTVKLGNLNFVIAGTLISAPGQTGLSASVAPVVYIPLQYLEQTGLSQKGSRINYSFYFKFDQAVNMDELVKKIEPRLETEGVNYDTVESQKEDTVQIVKRSDTVLSADQFYCFIAGLYWCSQRYSYLCTGKNKFSSHLTLPRCTGQAGIFNLSDTNCCHRFYWFCCRRCIRNDHSTIFTHCIERFFTGSYYHRAFLESHRAGFVIRNCDLFFVCLIATDIHSQCFPVEHIRLSFQSLSLFKDPVKWLVYLAIMLFIFGFSYIQLNGIQQAIFFTLGVLIAFLILVGIAALLMWAVRRFFPDSWSYLWRQGLANLFRPNNQTTILIVAIGLGTAFICTMFSVQSILLNRVMLSASGNQSNTVLFDIQPKQKDSVIALAQATGSADRWHCTYREYAAGKSE